MFRLNNNMSKFDLVYEKLLCKINEKEYTDSTFVDNVRLLVKLLKDNDYVDMKKDVDTIVKETMAQPNNVKELRLDTQEDSIPAMKLKLKQESDSESFSVTIIDLAKPAEQKTFANSMLESIFDDVITYIKTVALEGAKPEAAVEELPDSEGANAQPGAQASALPGAAPEAAAAPEQQPPT